MNIELIIKALTLLGVIAGAAKLFYEMSMGRRSRMREEYKFAKEFFSDLKVNSDLHPFLREKGYHAIAGVDNMSGDEIEYLLSLTRPERALKDYVSGRNYLEHFPRSGDLQISFKDKYKKNFSRKWRLYSYVSFYLITAFLAFSPIIFSGFLHTSFSQKFYLSSICIFFFGPYALLALNSGRRIYRAQVLVENQGKHTAKIMLPRINHKNS